MSIDARFRGAPLILGAFALPLLAIVVAATALPQTDALILRIALLLSLAIGAIVVASAIEGFWHRIGGGLTYVFLMAPLCFLIMTALGCGLHGECL